MSEYTDMIEEQTEELYQIAEKARAQNKDPEPNIDVPRAEDLAAKAVGLVTASLFPELGGETEDQIKERVRELEDQYAKNDERVALAIGKEIAQEKFYDFDEKVTAIDAGLRIGLAYMTGGIVTAPLEGVSDVQIRTNDDGSEYLAVYYAGPIRSAGGTASAMSVLLADYIRKEVGLDRYKPTDTELDRYATEVEDYFTRVTKKQYTPERKETRLIAEHVPIEVTGTPTEDLEVSNFKDLNRIETNRIRGGMCLIYLDGLPLKASKIKKRIDKYGEQFDIMHWEWVKEYLDLQHEIHSSGSDEADDSDDEADDEHHYEPSDAFLESMTAGRPVFSHPGRYGGFRMRYGRARTAGLAAIAYHPATLAISQDFMAVGTQLKTEYPGKGTVATPCDSVEPPVVRLENGDVVRVESREQAEGLMDDIEQILFMGDVLVPYGEFLENGKDLLPSPWVEEWWAQVIEDAIEEQGKDIDVTEHIEKPYPAPAAQKAIAIAKATGTPLHPAYTYPWQYMEDEEFAGLHAVLAESDGQVLEHTEAAKAALERLFITHTVTDDGLKIDEDTYHILNELLQPDETAAEEFMDDIAGTITANTGIELRQKAPIFLGARMGRPEKAERRFLKGKPQVMFPCGRKEGGRMRNLTETFRKGSVRSEVLGNYCPECEEYIPYAYCPFCGADEVEEHYKCAETGKVSTDPDELPGFAKRSWRRKIDVERLYRTAMDNLGLQKAPDLLKSPRGVTGKHKHVEPIEKGLLRQRYDLYVNKDGTIRYDATDVPITHFKPFEIGVSVEKLRELGYTHDVHGEELTNDDQMLELKYQDIIIPADEDGETIAASDYMLRVAKYVDDLLEEFYGLEPYFNAETKDDLVGALTVGLAPHTSGGVVGRIIGFTDAKGIYAHPFWHAAKRRNCDGDEDSIMLLMDSLLNFSRQFLPDMRGSRTMDAPLILSTVLLPDEVDDESWNVDIIDQYPRDFYEATYEYKKPYEVDIPIAEDLSEDGVFAESGFSYTHETTDIRDAPFQSSYVRLGAMTEKVKVQFDLQAKIAAVDEHAAAELLLDKHFVPDIKGNLRAFSRQRFRCINCNDKYRRVPLKGRCTSCGGKLLLTVSEGAIKKYLLPSEEIADNYQISAYRRQQIMMMKENIQSLFGKDERQTGLDQFTN